MTVWPAPIVRFVAGDIDLDATLAAADPDPFEAKGHLCEARFYGAELRLVAGAKDDAVRLFRLAAADCPKDYLESPAANAELRALGAAP